MKIAIHAADLDHQRIDGTRVYIFNMLKNFGILDVKDEFFIYHKAAFNQQLTPPVFSNYFIQKIPFPKFWTQTRFAWQIFWDKPQALWMPMHNIPKFRRKKLKVVVTIHDLAFKIFPEYFPKKELIKLNRLSDYAIRNARGIISISQSTKDDILKIYPEIAPDKIKVIRHGFDNQLFQKEILQSDIDALLGRYGLVSKGYLLYVGAIQPRKNLITLIEAFEKNKPKHPKLKLVFAGEPAWNFKETLEKIKSSKFADDIVVTGKVPFEELPIFYRQASIFVFPSLYEGFGIPILEAFASKVPVICAKNSSLTEVGGEAASYFEADDAIGLSGCIERILTDDAFAKRMIERGVIQASEFSWRKCAEETLDFIKNV